MKLLLLSLLFISMISTAVAQKERLRYTPQKVTRLRVIESAAFGMDKEFIVTANSIIVDIKKINGGHSQFSKALTVSEHDELLSSFNEIYLSNIQSSYQPKSIFVADAAVFEVSIFKGKSVKITQVQIIYKWEPLFAFGKKLDRLLPSTFKMNYSAGYFSK